MADKISVIVPVYKTEEYLDKCVKSIINQTYKNLEIILVDDGSPDNCPKMCDDWANKDSRIKVIHKTNGGLSSARNAGIEAAAGNYLMFTDSDDFLEDDMIEFLYNLIKKVITILPDVVSILTMAKLLKARTMIIPLNILIMISL